MAAYQSYPPSLWAGLPASHDLQLVGNVTPGTLTVNFTWDSDGDTATLAYGDGQSITTSAEAAVHTYAANGEYTATVTSGAASDSAVLDLSAAQEPEPDPEPTGEPTEPPYEAESP